MLVKMFNGNELTIRHRIELIIRFYEFDVICELVDFNQNILAKGDITNRFKMIDAVNIINSQLEAGAKYLEVNSDWQVLTPVSA